MRGKRKEVEKKRYRGEEEKRMSHIIVVTEVVSFKTERSLKCHRRLTRLYTQRFELSLSTLLMVNKTCVNAL